MLRRDSGSILVDGLDCIREETRIKKLIGYVSDESIFVEEWETPDVARALALYYETFDSRRFRDYLNRFELPEKRKIKDFSRGMKTRLMLAAVLSRNTRLLLLDEPTSGLDPVVRVDLLDILQDYISDGEHSVLFSTHITTDLEKVADFITFIYHGRLMFTKNKDEALSDYRIVRGSPAELSAELKGKLIGLRENGMGFEGLLKSEDAGILPPGAVAENPTLDEIVVYHTMGVQS